MTPAAPQLDNTAEAQAHGRGYRVQGILMPPQLLCWCCCGAVVPLPGCRRCRPRLARLPRVALASQGRRHCCCHSHCRQRLGLPRHHLRRRCWRPLWLVIHVGGREHAVRQPLHHLCTSTCRRCGQPEHGWARLLPTGLSPADPAAGSGCRQAQQHASAGLMDCSAGQLFRTMRHETM